MNVPAGASPVHSPSPLDRRLALIVENDSAARTELENHLADHGFELLVAVSGAHAIDLLENNRVDIVFVKVLLRDMNSSDLVRYIRTKFCDAYLPVVMLVSGTGGDGVLRECISAGADDFINYQHTQAEIDTRITAMDQLRELKDLFKQSIHEQVVAKQILSVALSARGCNIDGMQVYSRSAAIFSGDLVLAARNPDGGLNILLADFTGHGLSAAVGVLPVSEMFTMQAAINMPTGSNV